MRVVIGETILDGPYVAELRKAVVEREDSLKKLRNKIEDAGLSTADVDYHLELIRGGDGAVGLKQYLDEQRDAFEDSDTRTLPFEGAEAPPSAEEEAEAAAEQIDREIDGVIAMCTPSDLDPDLDDGAIEEIMVEHLYLDEAENWECRGLFDRRRVRVGPYDPDEEAADEDLVPWAWHLADDAEPSTDPSEAELQLYYADVDLEQHEPVLAGAELVERIRAVARERSETSDDGPAADIEDLEERAAAIVAQNVPEVERDLAAIHDPTFLDLIEEAEAAGKDRKGVAQAIAERHEQLQADALEEPAADTEPEDSEATGEPEPESPGEPEAGESAGTGDEEASAPRREPRKGEVVRIKSGHRTLRIVQVSSERVVVSTLRGTDPIGAIPRRELAWSETAEMWHAEAIYGLGETATEKWDRER